MSTGSLPADAGSIYRRYISAVVLHGLATAEAVGFNATDLYAFSILELAGSMTSGELAARTGLTTGAATRLIDRLERRGVVARIADPGDRRKVIVKVVGRLDPAGGALDGALGPARRRIAELFGGYTTEQLAALFDYFSKAAGAYQDATEQVREDRRRARDR